MPEPPPVGLLTRFVLENPYPLGIGLLMIAVVLGGLGLRDGPLDRLRLALVPAALAVAVLGLGGAVVTSGERARVVTAGLVEDVVLGDVVGAAGRFFPDALLHVGAPTNVGRDLDAIVAGLSRFADAYTVEDNRISMLRAFTESADAATVHLACWTEAGGYGPSVSQWVLEIERQGDGTWKVTRLTWISLNGQPPPRH